MLSLYSIDLLFFILKNKEKSIVYKEIIIVSKDI